MKINWEKRKNRRTLFIILAVVFFFLSAALYYYTLPAIEYRTDEAIVNPPRLIEYIIHTTFSTKGDFVSNHKIDVKIEVEVAQGEDFKNVSDVVMFVGKIGDAVYRYPLAKTQQYYSGAIIENIKISDDYKKLTGEMSVVYLVPKEYDVYAIHFKTKSGKEYSFVSSKKIDIKSEDILNQKRFNKFTIISTLLFLLFSVLSFFKK